MQPTIIQNKNISSTSSISRNILRRASITTIILAAILLLFTSVSDPLAAAYQTEHGELVFSTLLGGSDWESGEAVAVDENGAIYVIGRTPSIDFPTTANAHDNSVDNIDVFVAKIGADGKTLEYGMQLFQVAHPITNEKLTTINKNFLQMRIRLKNAGPQT